jgi:hypothetical protein
MFKSVFVGVGIAMSIALVGFLNSALAQATPQSEAVSPLLPVGLIEALHTGDANGHFSHWQGVNSVIFLGTSCDNSFDLTTQTLSSRGVNEPIMYSYSNGDSLHVGETSTPDQAVQITHVCWALFFAQPTTSTPVG